MNATNEIQITIAGALFVDISRESVGERVGAKRPVRYEIKLGGSAGNMLRALGQMGLRINVHSAAHPFFIAGIRAEVRRLGGTPFITESEDALAISQIEQGSNGGSLLDVHRPTLRHKDIATDDFTTNIRASALSILGPISEPSEAVLLMKEMTDSAQRSVMIPHPKVLVDPGFASGAQKMAAIILNRDEANRIAPSDDASCDPVSHLRCLIGGETDIVVTNGRETLVAWAQNNCHEKRPRDVGHVRSDFGAGDTLAGRYFYYRFVAGLAAGTALDQALDDVAAFLQAPAKPAKSANLGTGAGIHGLGSFIGF